MERLEDSGLTSHEPASDQPEPTVNELKADISEAQGQLHETLAEIQQRLSPAHLADQAKATVRDATVGRVTNMAEQVGEKAGRVMSQTRRAAAEMTEPIRQNPWPLALIGAGVAWYVASARSQADRRWQRDEEWETGSFEANEYAEYSEYPARSRSMTERSRTPQVATAATDLNRRVREASRATQNRLGHAIQDNPVVTGVVALAAGALIGTLLPRTDLEDRYLGETRDNVVDSARGIAEDNVQRLKNAVAGEEASVPSEGAPSTFTS